MLTNEYVRMEIAYLDVIPIKCPDCQMEIGKQYPLLGGFSIDLEHECGFWVPTFWPYGGEK